jgi:hypothetical protein
MKVLTTVLAFLLLTLGTSPSAHAQYSRVAPDSVARDVEAIAIETFRGRQMAVSRVALPQTRNARELLDGHQIEFNDGTIIYPQEVQWVIVEEARPPREFEYNFDGRKRMPREFE